jgi:IS5 family transposase
LDLDGKAFAVELEAMAVASDRGCEAMGCEAMAMAKARSRGSSRRWQSAVARAGKARLRGAGKARLRGLAQRGCAALAKVVVDRRGNG